MMPRRKRSLGGRSQAGYIGATITVTRALLVTGQSGLQEGGSPHGERGATKGRSAPLRPRNGGRRYLVWTRHIKHACGEGWGDQ